MLTIRNQEHEIEELNREVEMMRNNIVKDTTGDFAPEEPALPLPEPKSEKKPEKKPEPKKKTAKPAPKKKTKTTKETTKKEK